MNVGIIGTGRMGRGCATALSGTHDVTVGSRDPERARRTASKTGAARGGTYAGSTRRRWSCGSRTKCSETVAR